MLRLNNFTIGTRLGIGFGLAIAVLGGFSIYAIDNLNRLSLLTEKLYQHPYTVSTALLRIQLNTAQIHRQMKEILVTEDRQELEAIVNDINNHEKLVYQDFALVHERFLGNKAEVTKAQAQFAKWKPRREQVIQLKRANKTAEAIILAKDNNRRIVDQLTQELKGISDFAANRARLFVKESEIARDLALKWLIGVVIALILVSTPLAVLIIRSIVLPLQDAVRFHNRLAQGELNLGITSTGSDEVSELLNSLNYVVENFQQVVNQVQQVSAQIIEGSHSMSASSSQISSGVVEQASATQEVSISIENMTDGMRRTSEMANSTQSIAMRAAADTELTSQAMQLAVDSMTTIGKQVLFIEDIAAQTNMLALNASIEAVRSHDTTNGFSVVAVQIRNLANHTREATVQINQLSNDSISSVQSAGNMLEKLVPTIQKTAEAVSNISQLNQEQLNGVKQIRQAIHQLDQVTGQNETMAAEIAAMATTLARQSNDLQQAIAFFKRTR